MNDLKTISYHCHNHNNHTIGLAFEGDFTREQPTASQLCTGTEIMDWLDAEFDRIWPTKRHRDMPDNQTACPGNFPIEDLGGEPTPTLIQEALNKIGKAKNTMKTGYELGMRYLDEAEEHLLDI